MCECLFGCQSFNVDLESVCVCVCLSLVGDFSETVEVLVKLSTVTAADMNASRVNYIDLRSRLGLNH